MNRFTDGQKYPLQPTLPNTVNGIIAKWPHPEWERREIHAVQCQSCGLVQIVHSLALTTILFNSRHNDSHRRCFPCRVARMEAEFPDCPCHNCADLRKEARR